ncbi:MAG TPA: hypothetical protein VFC47_16470 [Caulobacteraceae bacterium]|nr:hypothetical protein [Caulobacteraceae bacterium]
MTTIDLNGLAFSNASDPRGHPLDVENSDHLANIRAAALMDRGQGELTASPRGRTWRP